MALLIPAIGLVEAPDRRSEAHVRLGSRLQDFQMETSADYRMAIEALQAVDLSPEESVVSYKALVWLADRPQGTTMDGAIGTFGAAEMHAWMAVEIASSRPDWIFFPDHWAADIPAQVLAVRDLWHEKKAVVAHGSWYGLRADNQ